MAHNNTFPIPSCHECSLQSAGRCPTCHHTLCLDHFPRQEHTPCRAQLEQHAADYICYVCGAAVQPQQWSSAVFAHYVDTYRCAGCQRYLCDKLHTQVREEDVQLVRDGLRSHRYHITKRYCSICAPMRRIGGLTGAAWLAVTLSGFAATGLLVYVQAFHH